MIGEAEEEVWAGFPETSLGRMHHCPTRWAIVPKAFIVAFLRSKEPPL